MAEVSGLNNAGPVAGGAAGKLSAPLAPKRPGSLEIQPGFDDAKPPLVASGDATLPSQGPAATGAGIRILNPHVFGAQALTAQVDLALQQKRPARPAAPAVSPADALRARLQTQFGARFSADFTEAELRDAQTVLAKMTQEAGNLKQFDLNFTKVAYNPAVVRRGEPDNPLNGYYTIGDAAPDNPGGQIPIAPKTVVDAYGAWMQTGGRTPQGEEGMFHGFQWTLSHEITHRLAYRVGVAYELNTPFIKPENPSPQYTAWDTINQDIRAHAKPLGRVDGGWANERPEGFPTFKSYFAPRSQSGDNEVLADCGAYLTTGSHYADQDPFLKKRLDYTAKFFEQIKRGQLKPVDEAAYQREHVGIH